MNFKAAVIGHPIQHSLSPSIFEFVAKELGEKRLAYSAQDVKPEDLLKFLKAVREDSSWIGFNATIPHKEAILKAVDDVAPAAHSVGAANVVHVKDGRLQAYNTDVLGIESSLRQAGVSLKDEKVLIFGAGGAARAAAFACASEKPSQIVILNRNLPRALSLVSDYAANFSEVTFSATDSVQTLQTDQFSLLIQATPIGMAHHESSADHSQLSIFQEMIRAARPNGVAFDLIYRPERTPFLIEAEKKGLKTIGGLYMLIDQALATWDIWFAGSISQNLRSVLREGLANNLRQKLNSKPGDQ